MRPKMQDGPITLDGLTIQQLLDVRARADVMLGQRIDQERRDLTTKLRALDDYRRSVRSTDAKREVSKDVKKVRQRPKPKYRDPATGQTWAGRGQTPRWLKAEIAKGRAADEFRVQP